MKTFREKLLGKASAKETFRESFIKAQSAMEYLMTYGWAILVISVVLAALFQLGVFNPMTFAPKAPPGACQVFRPNGPYTTSFINLEGVCSGELPQYVGKFSMTPSSLSSNVTINYGWPNGTSITIVAWADPYSYDADGIVGTIWYDVSNTVSNQRPPTIYFNTCNNGVYLQFMFSNTSRSVWWVNNPTAGCISLNSWHQFVGVINQTSHTAYNYEDGKLMASLTFNGIVQGTHYILIGDNPGAFCCGGDISFNGTIANVQIYNTSLSANEIQALYLEGIGGAPINLQHLVGWWPLNGNANDYSGNGNNGVPSNVIFVSNWYSGYTPP